MTAERRATRLFVDAVDDDTARVLLGERVFTIPAELLPAGASEGDWVELSVGVIPSPPSEAEEIRERLAKDDPGGPIKL